MAYVILSTASPFLIAMLFAKKEIRAHMAFLLLGMLMCLFAQPISGFFSLRIGIGETEASWYIIPIIEELVKFLPLFLYVLFFDVSNERIVQANLCAAAGFALCENVYYLNVSYLKGLAFIFMRSFAGAALHVICALALSYGIVLARNNKAGLAAGLFGAFSIAIVYHATYNLLVSQKGAAFIAGICMPLATILVIYGVYKATRRMMRFSRGSAAESRGESFL